MYDILELNKKLVPELREIAKELDVKKFEALKKQDLVYKILDTQAIREAEKTERKTVVKEQPKEEKGLKAFLVKKTFTPENKNTQQEDLRGNRPRRERIEPILKHERVETGKKKNVQKESAVQSRQEQIKAIIKGFGREKPPIQEPEQKAEVVNLIQNEVVKPIQNEVAKPVQNEMAKPIHEKKEKTFHPKPVQKKEFFKVEKNPQRFEEQVNFDIPEDIELPLAGELPVNEDVQVMSEQENTDQQIVQKPRNENQNNNQNQNQNGNNKQKIRQFEFEGIITNTGVLEILVDGYG